MSAIHGSFIVSKLFYLLFHFSFNDFLHYFTHIEIVCVKMILK